MKQNFKIKLGPLMCSACAMKIEKQLEISQGVLSANVDFTNLLVTGQFDPEITLKHI